MNKTHTIIRLDELGAPVAWLDEILAHITDREAVGAWCQYLADIGADWAEQTADDFREVFAGEANGTEDFAQNLADECGLIDEHASWPMSFIDWERAARELMYDYVEVRRGGVSYFFRSY